MAQTKPTVTLVGNVGQQHDLKYSSSGHAVLKFSVAVRDRVRDGEQWVDGETTWFDIVCFGYLAEAVSDIKPKGKRVIVQGLIKKNVWEDKNGVKHSNVEVIADEVGVIPFKNKDRRVIRSDQMESAPF